MKSNIIVFDITNQPFLNNRIFDQRVSKSYPGANSVSIFYDLAIASGFKVYTSDYVIDKNIDISGAFVITEMYTKWTNKLKDRGAILLILVCGETPSFAWKFYSNLNKISSKYIYSFLFKGCEKRVSDKTIFSTTFFPQPDAMNFKRYNISWENRKFLTLINSNQIRRIIKPMHILASLFDNSLKQELYTLRLNAIDFFHDKVEFDLYGRNWDKKLWGIPRAQYLAALKCYKGSVNDKVETLSNYKFTICFENAIYEGYITEKIFDSFYAGSVPIYFGAPDVLDYIPAGCFIDFREFENFDKLLVYINNISKSRFNEYLSSISKFLDSPEFLKFSETTLANKLLNTILNEINIYEHK
jgi:hypothetical protein